MSILEVKNVSIRYMTGDFKDIGLKEYVMRRLKNNYRVQEFWADRDITFTLEKGDMLGIIGTNGAGKSTLLKAISGIMEPTKGYVKRQGTVAALLELASGFDGDLTVRENAYLRGAMLGYTRKFMDETYEKIINFAELRDFQDRPFKQLSSGMKSRLAFAIASLVQPDILILDEVLSVGDGAFRKKSEAKMREIIQGGATTILVSHSTQQVRELCNKVLWLEKGQQIAYGDTDILCDLYQSFLDKKITLPQAKQIWDNLNRRYDFLIVGAGLYGSVFAREATDHGKSCLVIDKRPHIGGNTHCEEIEGITVHKYGAHIFHTDREDVWSYVNRFAKFLPYTHKVTARNGEQVYSIPFNMHTFRQMWGVMTPEEAQEKIAEQRVDIPNPANLEEQALTLVGRDIYETLIKGYTEKQWGRPCKTLPTSILQRIPLRFEYDDRYFADKYQGIPEGGYDRLVEKLLEGSTVVTGLSYQKLAVAFPNIAERIIYTGPIDQFFDYSMGRLEYRSLRFEEEILEQEDFQGQAVVNYCDDETPYTRIIEHRHFAGQEGGKTVITREYPEDWRPGKEPYYPIVDERNGELYQRYLMLAGECPNVIFGGRLGEYLYSDMDDVVAAALEKVKEVLAG